MIETQRLVLRSPMLGDVPALFEILGDPETMRLSHRLASPRALARRLAVLERRRRRDGFALWTILDRSGGRIIGRGGLYMDPFDPGAGPELAYWFHPDVWGRGLGRELVSASLALADGPLGLPHLAAFARPDNAASVRLLRGAGFVVARALPEIDRLLFSRTAPRPG